MKTASIPAILFAAMTLTLSAQSGGDLTPPAGAPGKTMKSLDEVEARTAISTLPFNISTPGSYYLTKSLSSTTDGVTITANNVTLDLNGFTLNGSGTSASHEGIRATGTTGAPLQNIAISNGVITGFGNSVEFAYVNNSLLTQLHCSGSAVNAIELSGCDGNTVSNSSISKAGGIGIYLSGFSSQCDGNTVSHCSISNAGSSGIYLDGGSSGQCDGNTVNHCNVSNAGNSGIVLSGNSGQCDGNSVSHCRVSNSGGIVLSGSSGQCNGNNVNHCNVSNPGNIGINLFGSSSGQCDGNTVSHCSVSNAGSVGIYLSGSGGQCDGNHLTNNTVRGAVDIGVFLFRSHSCRVEGNHVSGVTSSGTSNGIYLDTSTGDKNLVVRNSCSGQDDNFLFDSDDSNGPEVTTSGALATTGAAAHPWANFSH